MSDYTINSSSILELMKRKGENGDSLTIAEILNQRNDMMQDISWTEANGTTSHKVVLRNSLPEGQTRKLNEGVFSEASTTKEASFGMALYETRSVVDKRLVDLAPNPTEYRMSEAKAFIEGLSQRFQRDLIYGTKVASEDNFDGIATILNSKTDKEGQDRPTVALASGTGNNLTSIYIVNWDVAEGCFCAYPKGSKTVGGVNREDMGVTSVEEQDRSGAKFRAYEDYFSMEGGFCFKNPRAIGRIANIDPKATFDEDLLYDVMSEMDLSKGRPMLYMNRQMHAQFKKRINEKANVSYSQTEVFGKLQATFDNIPIRMVEQIANTESEIS